MREQYQIQCYLHKRDSCSRQSDSFSLGLETHAEDPGEGSTSRTDTMQNMRRRARKDKTGKGETVAKTTPIQFIRMKFIKLFQF